MWILYDIVFLIIVLVYLPVYLFRRKFHRGFFTRLGFLPEGLALNGPIWIHAVSVGEAMVVKNLIKELRVAWPDKKFFISTVTPTGNKIARGIARESDFVAYFPLDLSFIVRRVVDKVKPSLFIITETEIWPNLISCLYRKNIPIVLVNGRISDNSFKGYLCIKFLLKPVLNKINLFCVQTQSDAERLLCLGLAADRIKITGNMKFDASVHPDIRRGSLSINGESFDVTQDASKDAEFVEARSRTIDNTVSSDTKVLDSTGKYRSLLGMKPEDKLWVCGSTHRQEEEIILDVYKKLLGEFPQLKLLIAPRHPSRAGEIDKIVSRFGFRTVLVSTLPLKPCSYLAKPVFILDTVGELINFYNIASIVFVGGSLIKKGGHNILEPVILGKPVIFGPYMFNFRDIARLFLQDKACVLVHNKEELTLCIIDLLNNPHRITELTQRAKAIILRNQGATTRNLEYINNYLLKEEGGLR